MCDGAAPNLTVVKSTHGYSGAYNVNSELNDQYKVKPFFANPFNPPHLIHWFQSSSKHKIGTKSSYNIMNSCLCSSNIFVCMIYMCSSRT